jgi:hypothetical protein
MGIYGCVFLLEDDSVVGSESTELSGVLRTLWNDDESGHGRSLELGDLPVTDTVLGQELHEFLFIGAETAALPPGVVTKKPGKVGHNIFGHI